MPTTSKDSLKAFYLEFGHQYGRRKQFELTGYDRADFSEILNALGKLVQNRFADAHHLIQLRTEMEQLGPETAFASLDQSERGFLKLGLCEHARVATMLKAFASQHAVSSEVVDPIGCEFKGRQFEQERLKVSAVWDEAQSHLEDQGLIDKVVGLMDISFVSPVEYDHALVDEIVNSDAFKSMGRDPKNKAIAGSDTVLRNSLKHAEFELKFYFWTLSGKGVGLALSNKGHVAIPDPAHRTEDPVARFWPSNEQAFPLLTDIAESRGTQSLYLKQFLEAITLISERQKQLKPWMGAGLASICARLCHPRATYRNFLHLGGFGCSSRLIFIPWRDVVISGLVLLLAIRFFDLGSIPLTLMEIGQVSFLTWSIAALQGAFAFVLFLSFVAQLITGVSILHGTILRGMGRQFIRGSTNLPETGKTNFVLRLMDRTK